MDTKSAQRNVSSSLKDILKKKKKKKEAYSGLKIVMDTVTNFSISQLKSLGQSQNHDQFKELLEVRIWLIAA